MPYYRADRRDGLEVVKPAGLYDDGDFCRPDSCEAEVAFADSPGGAVYGAATQFFPELYSLDEPKRFAKDLAKGERIVAKFHIYETDERPDYDPCVAQQAAMLGVVEDFDITGEVRYCRPVRVKKVGEFWLNLREVMFISTLGQLEHAFRFTFPECPDLNDKACLAPAVSSMLEGDRAAIEAHLVPEVEPLGSMFEETGCNEVLAQLIVEQLDREFWAERAALGWW